MRQCLQTLFRVVTSKRRLLLISEKTENQQPGEEWRDVETEWQVELLVLSAMSSSLQESLAPCHQTHPGRVTSELWSGWTWKRSMEAAMVTTSMAFVSMETETCSGWLIRKACLLTNLNSTHTLLPWNAWNWGFEKEHSTRVRSPYSRAGISDPQQLGPKWKLKT